MLTRRSLGWRGLLAGSGLIRRGFQEIVCGSKLSDVLPKHTIWLSLLVHLRQHGRLLVLKLHRMLGIPLTLQLTLTDALPQRQRATRDLCSCCPTAVAAIYDML